MGAACGSAGERCMAISVAVPVTDAVADALIERLKPRIKALRIGPSTDPATDMGPLVTRAHLDRVRGYIDRGEAEGANVVVDGRTFRQDRQGYYIGGTLLDRVTPGMSVWKDELFGPVLSVVRSDCYEDVVALVHRHDYANGAAIFTRDGDAARRFAQDIEVGMVGVNVPNPRSDGVSFLRRMEGVDLRGSRHARDGGRPLLHAHQDHDHAMAHRHPRRSPVLHADAGIALWALRTAKYQNRVSFEDFALAAAPHADLYAPQKFRRSSAVEQLTVNQLVVGSIPTAGANITQSTDIDG